MIKLNEKQITEIANKYGVHRNNVLVYAMHVDTVRDVELYCGFEKFSQNKNGGKQHDSNYRR